MNETDKLITEQFNRLPKPLQDVLNTVPWKSRVDEISFLKALSLEQVEAVKMETMFVLYRFESAEDYVTNLMREAQIDETLAVSIAEEADKKIFKEIFAKVDQSTPVETKEQAMERLTQRMRGESLLPVQSSPSNLPMVEEGEVAHSVPHVKQPEPDAPVPPSSPASAEQKPQTQPSGVKYPDGKDPYREPLI